MIDVDCLSTGRRFEVPIGPTHGPSAEADEVGRGGRKKFK